MIEHSTPDRLSHELAQEHIFAVARNGGPIGIVLRTFLWFGECGSTSVTRIVGLTRGLSRPIELDPTKRMEFLACKSCVGKRMNIPASPVGHQSEVFRTVALNERSR